MSVAHADLLIHGERGLEISGQMAGCIGTAGVFAVLARDHIVHDLSLPPKDRISMTSLLPSADHSRGLVARL